MKEFKFEDRPKLDQLGYTKHLKDYENGRMSTVIKPFTMSGCSYEVGEEIFVRYSVFCQHE